MSTSQGLGRRRPPLLAFVPWAGVFDVGTTGEQAGQQMARELYFGGYPAPVVQIPLGWIDRPITYRWDSKRNIAEVSQVGGATARSSNLASLNEQQWKATASLTSIVDVDAGNLAKWITDYYTRPLARTAALTVQVAFRTQVEMWRILGVKQGTHIRLTQLPAGWPDGAAELVVEGVTHQVLSDRRTVTWVTVPVIGASVGTSGPWFRWDDSRYSSSTDKLPF